MDRPRYIGRFEVIDKIGQGGMGVLWLAKDTRLERLVAIKQLWTHNDDVRRRFLREAAVAAKLQHPNIVTIYDTAEHDGQPFIAMEYIAGKTLAAMIKARSAGPTTDRLDLMVNLCDGLGWAHKAGVVHRDIKPANLMLNDEGKLKILDFGIARVIDMSVTQDGVTLGTPNYMSPEQVEGQHVDHRSDIFAVGAVLYELLSYRQAFPGDAHHMVALRILHDEPEPLSRFMPGLEPRLADIVARCLRKRPADRYQDLAQMRRDLLDIRNEMLQVSTEDTAIFTLPGAATPPPPPAPPTPATPGGRGQRFDLDALKRRREEMIARHLAAADRALAGGLLAEAQEAVEAAATIDPDNVRVLAAHEQVRRAVAVRQADDIAAEARECAAGGALTDAMRRLDEAERVHPMPGELAGLRAEIQARIGARERERVRRRAVDEALARARREHERGEYELAIVSADEALGLDPRNADALALKRTASETLAEQRRMEEEARRVDEAVAASDAALARDDIETARAALARCASIEHPALSAAAARVDERQAERDRAERERQRQEREAERERLARERWIDEQCRRARNAMDEDAPDLALGILDAIIPPPVERSDVSGLRSRAVELQQEKRLQERASRAAAAARQEFDQGRRTPAIETLRGFSPPHPLVSQALEHLQAEDARLREEEAREAAARDRMAREARAAVDAARALFDRGERHEALAMLREFGGDRALVASELQSLVIAADIETRVDRASALVESDRPDDARIALTDLLDDLEHAPSVWGQGTSVPAAYRERAHGLLARVDSELARRADAERRRQEAEHARALRAERRKALFDDLRVEFRAGNHARGVEKLEAAGSDDPVVAAVRSRMAAGLLSTPDDPAPSPLTARANASLRLQSIDAALTRARAFARAGRRSRALACVERALLTDPRCAEALVLRDWLAVALPGSSNRWDVRRALVTAWDRVVLSTPLGRRSRAS